MDKYEFTSEYQITKAGYGDGYNILLKSDRITLLVAFISMKEEATIRINNIKEYGSVEQNFYIYKMEGEDSFYFMLSMNQNMYRGDILAESDMFNSKSEVESLIKKIMWESRTTKVVDSTGF